MELDATVVLLLCASALLSGWIDAVSGGGGLLQLPSLLLAMPAQSPVTAMAVNKLSSAMGTAAATASYVRAVRPDFSTALPMAVSAIVGAIAGASMASALPLQFIRPGLVVLLIAAWLWTLLSPRMGMRDELRWAGRRRHFAMAILAGALIGAYDGVFGPGTGSFLLFVLVGLLGYSFLKASATAKVVNLCTNIAALTVFSLAGAVVWPLGLAMGACNALGAVVGARMAIRRGSEFVRIVFLVVVAVVIARLAWDLRG